MLEIGSVIDGKYKILNKIGQGGMSIVYLAMNERANKQWAVKEVRKDGVKDYDVVRQGLIAETDILKRLNHSNLPSIIDVIDRDDTFLIVMDYIEGKNLDYRLKKEGAQPQEKVVEWAKQICDVLGYLHSRRPPIIYRDLKPANIMLKPDGNIEIIDFGTAREFKESGVEDTSCLGTQGYAAPEQYGGQGQTDPRTDIYTLGATMYHLLTGHNPSQPPYEMYPIRYWNPSLSSGLEQIILKCTQRDPDMRYQNCAELMYALEHYTELDDACRKKQKRKMNAFLGTAVAAVVSLVLCIGFNVLRVQTTQTNYSYYLELAEEEAEKSGSDVDTVLGYYSSALSFDEDNPEAYKDMVYYCYYNSGEKRNISADEYVSLKAVVDKHICSLKQSSENDYIDFCYYIGWYTAYFSDTQFDYSKCGDYLLKVINADDAGTLTDTERKIADMLYRIAEFNNNVDEVSETVDDGDGDKYGGDQEDSDDISYSTYADYWDSLVDIIDEFNASSESVDDVTMITVYEALVKSVYNNVNQFRNAGISQTVLQEKLKEVREKYTELQDQGVSGYTSSDWEDMQSLADSAQSYVTSAFRGTSSEGGTADE